MSDGMGREFTYLSSHATNRYFIPNWGRVMHLPLTGAYLMRLYKTVMSFSKISTISLLATMRKTYSTTIRDRHSPSVE